VPPLKLPDPQLSSAPAVSGLRPPREGTRRPKPDRRAHPKTDRRAHAHKRPPPCLLPKFQSPQPVECLPRLTPAVPVARGRRRFSFPSLPFPSLSASPSVHIRLPEVPNTSSDSNSAARLKILATSRGEARPSSTKSTPSHPHPSPTRRPALGISSGPRRVTCGVEPPCRVQMVAEEARHCSSRRRRS